VRVDGSDPVTFLEASKSRRSVFVWSTDYWCGINDAESQEPAHDQDRNQKASRRAGGNDKQTTPAGLAIEREGKILLRDRLVAFVEKLGCPSDQRWPEAPF
jgi:hypothetical protein